GNAHNQQKIASPTLSGLLARDANTPELQANVFITAEQHPSNVAEADPNAPQLTWHRGGRFRRHIGVSQRSPRYRRTDRACRGCALYGYRGSPSGLSAAALHQFPAPCRTAYFVVVHEVLASV